MEPLVIQSETLRRQAVQAVERPPKMVVVVVVGQVVLLALVALAVPARHPLMAVAVAVVEQMGVRQVTPEVVLVAAGTTQVGGVAATSCPLFQQRACMEVERPQVPAVIQHQGLVELRLCNQSSTYSLVQPVAAVAVVQLMGLALLGQMVAHPFMAVVAVGA